MDEAILNDILNYVDADYLVTSLIVVSGQRIVYRAKGKLENSGEYVLKISAVHPPTVARIQRELKLLDEIDSEFFPKPVLSKFISKEQIQYFIDNLDPKAETQKIEHLKSLKLKPFFLTVENFIEHTKWETHLEVFKGDESIFLEFIKKVFTALNILWEKKIVHRDLKPDNILISANFVPVIIDLGIAKSMREGTQQITHIFGSSPCTPQFAAPEQLINNKAEITYKSDQFAVGVIAFWVLTGEFPYGSIAEIGNEDFLNNIIQGKPIDAKTLNPQISDNLNNFINRLINFHPYKRFRNYDEIQTALNF